MSLFDGSSFTVAVHVRRGDVTPITPNAFKYTPDLVFVECIELVRRRFRQHPDLTFHLFSEGNSTDFKTMMGALSAQGLAAKLHINAPLRLTFHHLVMASALIASKSSISRTAAYVRRGVTFPVQPDTDVRNPFASYALASADSLCSDRLAGKTVPDAEMERASKQLAAVGGWGGLKKKGAGGLGGGTISTNRLPDSTDRPSRANVG